MQSYRYWMDPDEIAGDYAPGDPNGLGWLSTVVTGVTALSPLFGQANEKDRERLQKNSDAYKLAMQGHQNCLEYLKYRSGRYGTAQHIGGPINDGPIGGWATTIAKDDAFRLYNSALAAWGMSTDDTSDGDGVTPPPNTGPIYTGGPVQTLPGVTTMGSMSYTPLLIAGVALALLARRGRR